MSIRPQPDLFDDMEMSAVISECGLYRTELRRVWNRELPLLVVCMLNPSTADHRKNDPTILALIHFGKLWGYGGLLIVNLYALRSSTPAALAAPGINPVGPDNHDYWRIALRYASSNGGRALAAWGNGVFASGMQERLFVRECDIWQVHLLCLGTTNSGAPKHPLARGKHRIPRDQKPIVWRAPA